jgi:hypothetical protein
MRPRGGPKLLLQLLVSSIYSMTVIEKGIPIGTRGCCLHLYTRRSHPCSLFELSSIPRNNSGSSELGTGYAMFLDCYGSRIIDFGNALLGNFWVGAKFGDHFPKSHPQKLLTQNRGSEAQSTRFFVLYFQFLRRCLPSPLRLPKMACLSLRTQALLLCHRKCPL